MRQEESSENFLIAGKMQAFILATESTFASAIQLSIPYILTESYSSAKNLLNMFKMSCSFTFGIIAIRSFKEIAAVFLTWGIWSVVICENIYINSCWCAEFIYKNTTGIKIVTENLQAYPSPLSIRLNIAMISFSKSLILVTLRIFLIPSTAFVLTTDSSTAAKLSKILRTCITWLFPPTYGRKLIKMEVNSRRISSSSSRRSKNSNNQSLIQFYLGCKAKVQSAHDLGQELLQRCWGS